MDMSGQTISQYKILRLLGGGGMGEVYLAEDTKLRRKVAIKFLLPQFASQPAFKDRFKREARAAAALNHPNIITVYGEGEFKDRLYIVMEYVEGESLSELITEDLPLRKVLEIGIKLCEGLSAAHKAGVIHRDLKPGNILVGKNILGSENAQIKIADFGLAKLKGATTLTQLGAIMGTPLYMSPEQTMPGKVDNRSDIFSLGVILYELITRKHPFKDRDSDVATDVLYKSIREDAPYPLARYNHKVPNKLQWIVDKALKKKRERRYQNVEDLLVDLRNLIDDFPKPRPKKWRKIFSLSITLSITFAVLIALGKPWISKFSGLKNGTILSIATTPAGAVVYLNNDSIGVTPLNFGLVSEGVSRVSLKKLNYFPLDTSVIFEKGQTLKLSLALQATATVSIAVNPAAAKVVLDGKIVPTSRLARLTLSVGQHNLSLSAQGYLSRQEQFSLQQGVNPTLTYSLDKIPKTFGPKIPKAPSVLTLKKGELQVLVNPFGSIYINDEPYATNTDVLFRQKLPVGRYKLTVTNSELEGKWEQQITIAPNRIQRIEVDFKKTVKLAIMAFMTKNNAREPVKADIYIDEQIQERMTPAEVSVRIGQHAIAVKRPGYETKGGPRTLNLTKDERLEFELKEVK